MDHLSSTSHFHGLGSQQYINTAQSLTLLHEFIQQCMNEVSYTPSLPQIAIICSLIYELLAFSEQEM